MSGTSRRLPVLILGLILVLAVIVVLASRWRESDDGVVLERGGEELALDGAERVRRTVPATELESGRTRESVDEIDASPLGSRIEPIAAPESRVIRGRVLRPDGEVMPGAHVGIFRLHEETTDSATALHATRSDADGRFELSGPDAMDALVIAQAAPFRPAVQSWFAFEANLELTLRLEESLESRGRVTYNGRIVTDGWVSFDAAFGTPGLFGAGDEMFWREGRPERKLASCPISKTGRFKAGNLGHGRHDVHVSPTIEGVHFDLLRSQTRRVAVIPDTDLDIALEAGEVQFNVLRDGVVATDVEIEISSIAGDAKGRLGARYLAESHVMALAPGESYFVSVSHPAVLPNRTEIRAPAAGEFLAVLLRVEATDRPRIEVRFDGGEASKIQSLDLRLAPSTRMPEPMLARGETLTAKVVRDGEGRLMSAPIPTEGGSFSMRVRPPATGPGCFLIFEDTTVNLPAAGVRVVTLRSTRGGRCQPRIRWTDGNGGQRLTWRLRNGEERVIRQESVQTVSGAGGLGFLSRAPDAMGGRHPTREVFPPGDYVLEIERESGGVDRREIVVTAGRALRPEIWIGEH